MANVYADTVLLAARAWIKEQDNKAFELRPVVSNIIEAYLLDREYTIPNLAAIKAATTQTTTAMYFKDKTFTIGTAKSNTLSGQQYQYHFFHLRECLILQYLLYRSYL